MRRLFYALPLLLGLARADVLTWAPQRVGKGYAGPLVADITWASDGTARDMTGASAVLTVYATPPSSGAGGVVLFTASLAPAGMPTNRLAGSLSGANTAVPGSYYAEIVLTQNGTVDTWHGILIVEGR